MHSIGSQIKSLIKYMFTAICEEKIDSSLQISFPETDVFLNNNV